MESRDFPTFIIRRKSEKNQWEPLKLFLVLDNPFLV